MEQLTGARLGKEYNKAVFCLPVYLTYMQSTSWETLDWKKSQAGLKIAGRNINNLRYADDSTLMAESEEELKSLLMRVKEESEEAGFKLSIQKTKIIASVRISSWQIDGETVTAFNFLGLQDHCRRWLQPWNEKTLAPWKKSYGKPRHLLNCSDNTLPGWKGEPPEMDG